jgi:adenine-specific DNA-methyltransferase
MTFEQAHTIIKDLILNFQKNENHYLSPTYSEAEVRQEYIDPFFTALGWDVGSKINKNPHEREVVIEKTQSQEDSFSKKRADYAFYIAPNFKKEVFFVEAKKPSRTLRLNKEDYFQTAKYGYNSGTGISILFDFEEFVMIDCRFKPDKDTVLATQIKYYKYTDFLEEEAFSEIFYLFSREAVASGKLQNYIQQLPAPKKVSKSRQLKLNITGQLTIDQDFLNFVEEARVHLAQAVYNNHPQLKNYELTEAVQKILDRLVFIRFLEDKSIEPEYIIQKVHTSPYPWNKFVEESRRLEAKYNSIVFKKAFFDKEDFLDKNNINFNETIIDFLASESPYNFNYIPIEIIGNIYERFLGKTIEIEENKVKIDLKPAVRKAGGVFYTPSYIVDYIIQNTIGKQIEDKSPKEIAKLTFADISCGSGSFLIGIFDYLIQYHQNYYFKNPIEAQKEGCIYDEDTATWKLSLNQKKQILLNNVYGVDIDHQATEVAQMSLLLKLLEHENLFTTSQQQSLFVADKILPTLSENIKSGNSLIGKDVVFQGKMTFDNYEEELKINPFDFEPAFPKVFKNGGFDAIVGNPPYVKEYTDREAFETVKIGKLKKYYQGKMDLWYFFACYGLDLLNSKGLLGYIAPNNWVSNAGASIMRNKVIQDSKIKELVDFGSFMVFKDASIQTMVMIFENNKKEDNYSFLYQNFNKNITETELQKELLNKKGQSSQILNPIISKNKFTNSFLKFGESNIEDILDKIKSKSNFILDEKKEVAQGIVTPNDSLNNKTSEILNFKYPKGYGVFVLNKDEVDNLNFLSNEFNIIKPLYSTNNLHRYLSEKATNSYIIYTDSKFKEKNSLDNYPNIKFHLDKFQDIITSDNKPYGLHRSRNEYFFKNEKIISLRKCSEPIFSYTDFDCYVLQTFNIIKSERINLKYLTGILNSKLVKFWLFNRGKMQGNMFQIDKEPLLQIPIFKTENKEQEDKMISLVNQMLESKQREKEATSDREKEYLAEHIKSLDYQIDHLVYEMYGLSDEEIEVVEGEK